MSYRYPRSSMLVIRCAIGAAVVVTLWVLISYIFSPEVIRAYRYHKNYFEKYAQRVLSGAVARRSDGLGFEVDDFLQQQGVTHVYSEADYVEFIFESLPPDATPMLIYSPEGLRGLPPANQSPVRTLVEFQRLDDMWYYRAEN
jgi:hypothetical protein